MFLKDDWNFVIIPATCKFQYLLNSLKLTAKPPIFRCELAVSGRVISLKTGGQRGPLLLGPKQPMFHELQTVSLREGNPQVRPMSDWKVRKLVPFIHKIKGQGRVYRYSRTCTRVFPWYLAGVLGWDSWGL